MPKPIAPTPWKVSESVGGKMFMYDANNKPIIIPNMTQTRRSAEDLVKIYRTIVLAVNALTEDRDDFNSKMERAMGE